MTKATINSSTDMRSRTARKLTSCRNCDGHNAWEVGAPEGRAVFASYTEASPGRLVGPAVVHGGARRVWMQLTAITGGMWRSLRHIQSKDETGANGLHSGLRRSSRHGGGRGLPGDDAMYLESRIRNAQAIPRMTCDCKEPVMEEARAASFGGDDIAPRARAFATLPCALARGDRRGGLGEADRAVGKQSIVFRLRSLIDLYMSFDLSGINLVTVCTTCTLGT